MKSLETVMRVKKLEKFFVLVALTSLLGTLAMAGRIEEECDHIDENRHSRMYHFCERRLESDMAEAGVDCIDCEGSYDEGPKPGVEIVSNLAGPLAMMTASIVGSVYNYKSQKTWANAYSDSNQAYAGAMRAGYEACPNIWSDYLDYNIARGGSPVIAAQATAHAETCNQMSPGMFAGMNGLQGNGFGGFGNGYLGAGYSPGFVGGMIGPNYPGMGMSGGGMGMGLNFGMGMGMPRGGMGFGMGMGMPGGGMGMGMPGGGMG